MIQSDDARKVDRVRMSLGTRSLYPFVLSYFSGIDRAKRSGLRVLDMPAGEGVRSSPLAASGFDVTPMDLFPEYLEKGERDRLGRGVVSAFEQETRATMPAWLRTRLFGDDSSDPVRPRKRTAASRSRSSYAAVNPPTSDL